MLFGSRQPLESMLLQHVNERDCRRIAVTDVLVSIAFDTGGVGNATLSKFSLSYANTL